MSLKMISTSKIDLKRPLIHTGSGLSYLKKIKWKHVRYRQITPLNY